MIFPNLDPPYWAPEGHSQTLIAHLTGPKINFYDENKKLIPCIEDEDQVLIKYHLRDSKKWVILAHGLAGSSESQYIKRLTKLALERDFSVLRFNHRNCGDSLGYATKPYHAGRGEDIYAAADWIRNKYPQSEIVVVGFSLSGNAVLDMLVRFEDKIEIKKTIAVNAPIDLKESSVQISKPENAVYNQYFVQLLRIFSFNLAKKMNNEFGRSVREIKVPLLATLRDFDDLFVARFSGYNDAWDYYAQCSTKKRLHLIKSPVTMLTAADDPIVPSRVFDDQIFGKNFHFRMEKTGGHMGYLSRATTPLNDNRWMDWYLIEHIQGVFKK